MAEKDAGPKPLVAPLGLTLAAGAAVLAALGKTELIVPVTVALAGLIKFGPTLQVAAASNEGSPRRKRARTRRPLPSPVWRHLEHDAVTRFRMQYQNFRAGGASGAEGEAEDLPFSSNFGARMAMSRLEGAALFRVATAEDHEEVQAEDEDPVEELQRVVNEWRLGYRKHRQGSAKGAKGDIRQLTDKVDDYQLNLLPTRKLIRLRKELKKRAAAPRQAARSAGIHVHFGAGKLGLGLIIPALVASGESFALVQRPSTAFQRLLKRVGKAIAMLVNGGAAVPLTLCASAADLPDWSADAGTPQRVLVLSSAEDVFRRLLGDASTLSTSLGPGLAGLGEMLCKVLPKKGAGAAGLPVLYAGENDHKAVDALAEKLVGRCVVVSCMVDRICTGREISDDTINVITEPFVGTIVVKPPEEGEADDNLPPPPFTGDHVLLPMVPAQAEYLCRRKLVTVNGMHTTLSFMALCQRPSQTALILKNDKLQAPEKDLPLVTLKVATAEQRRDIMAWCAARQLLLLFEFGEELMMLAHGVDEGLGEEERKRALCDILWGYASECVQRFSNTNDTCGRVLGGGVENRFRTRLLPVGSFVNETPKLDRISKMLLRIAGVSVGEMRAAVDRLVRASEDIVRGGMKGSEKEAWSA